MQKASREDLMADSLPQNKHPLNKRAADLLKEMEQKPWPNMLHIVQLLIETLGDVMGDPLTARLYHLDAKKVMRRVTPVLKAEDLADATPEEAGYLIAEAMGLDEAVAEPTPIYRAMP